MKASLKTGMHPRNRFRAGYDFEQLSKVHPALAAHVRLNPWGAVSIDYADPLAVKVLNQALLHQAYGLEHWDIPPGYLCPPIPGRSDYLHYLADLIGGGQGPAIQAVDIGMGANCIYPLLGVCEHGWRFVGAEVDPNALRWAQHLVSRHPQVAGLIECRRQTSPLECFRGIIQPGESFDVTLCNPPFHCSAQEAAEGTRRKLRNLSLKTKELNFGGKAGELWCDGGELAFIRRMIQQSLAHAKQCRWFTSLVSQSSHVQKLQECLRRVKAADVRVIEMAQGQKKSRILAWTFVH